MSKKCGLLSGFLLTGPALTLMGCAAGQMILQSFENLAVKVLETKPWVDESGSSSEGGGSGVVYYPESGAPEGPPVESDSSSSDAPYDPGSMGAAETSGSGTTLPPSAYKSIAALMGMPANADMDANRPGNDYNNFPVANIGECHTACVNDSQCKAFTFVKPGKQEPGARCWVKRTVQPVVADNCCISWAKPGGATTRNSSNNALRRK